MLMYCDDWGGPDFVRRALEEPWKKTGLPKYPVFFYTIYLILSLISNSI